MTKLQFNDLSVDIKTLIVSHVLRPSDLVNLCLTSKQLHEITVRYLYHSVNLDLGGEDDGRLSAFLSPKNIGLKHVRKVDLYLADVPDKCNQLRHAKFAVRMLIEFLPEDILETFSWHPWDEFDADNMLLLYKKQRRMKWLETIRLTRNITEQVKKLPRFNTMFDCVTSIGFYPDSQDVLDLSGLFLQNCKKLEKLSIIPNFKEETMPVPWNELNDSATGPGLLSRSIFKHLDPFPKCQPMKIKELMLQSVNLRYCSTSLMQVLDWPYLSALRIYNCNGADALLAEVTKSSKLPNKLRVFEFKHDDNRDDDGRNALDVFLTLVSGIEIMIVDLGYTKALPAAAGIARHSRTLKQLTLHASETGHESEEFVYSTTDFETICKNSKQLEQLSIAFPATSLIRAPSNEYQSFLNTLDYLPKLITLHHSTWPTNNPSTTRLPRKIYEHLLQSSAQTVFERHLKDPPTSAIPPPPPPPPASGTTAADDTTAKTNAPTVPTQPASRLNVVAYGCADKTYDRLDSQTQIIYVKGKKIDPFNQESCVAMPMGWCLRKYVEPRSDVLDFGLSHTGGPPVREYEEN